VGESVDEKNADAKSIWWTPRAIGLHVTIIVVLPTFLGLFWWQVQRVRQGNTLSWAYVFEWPFFAGYAVYLWWKLVHDQPEPAEEDGPSAAAARPDDQSLAAASTERRDVADAPAPRETAAEPHAAPTRGATADDAGAGDEERELAAYNRYLAQLNATGRRKRW
jgi:hypothetical protein